MGRFVFKLPDVGEGTAEAEIVAWHVRVGDMIEGRPAPRRRHDRQGDGRNDLAGQPARSSHCTASPARWRPSARRSWTSKSTAPATKPKRNERRRRQRTARPPHRRRPNSKRKETGARKARTAPSRRSRNSLRPRQSAAPRKFGDKPLASPAVRQRAHELGIHLQFIHGTGPAGRISHADLDAYIAQRRADGAHLQRRSPGAKAKKRSRSSACAARSRRRCRKPSAASRTSPMSKKST